MNSKSRERDEEAVLDRATDQSCIYLSVVVVVLGLLCGPQRKHKTHQIDYMPLCNDFRARVVGGRRLVGAFESQRSGSSSICHRQWLACLPAYMHKKLIRPHQIIIWLAEWPSIHRRPSNCILYETKLNVRVANLVWCWAVITFTIHIEGLLYVQRVEFSL